MTAMETHYMPNHRQMFRRSIGEVLSDMVTRRWPVRTAKAVAKTWNTTTTMGENTKKGHASIVLLEKAIETEGWDFLSAFGREITGQSYEEWLEQKHDRMVREAELAEQNIRRLRAQGSAVASQFADPDGVRGGEVPAPRRSARG